MLVSVMARRRNIAFLRLSSLDKVSRDFPLCRVPVSMFSEADEQVCVNIITRYLLRSAVS